MDTVLAGMPHRSRLWQPRYPGQASCGPEALRPRLATGLPDAEFRASDYRPWARERNARSRANAGSVRQSRIGARPSRNCRTDRAPVYRRLLLDQLADRARESALDARRVVRLHREVPACGDQVLDHDAGQALV